MELHNEGANGATAFNIADFEAKDTAILEVQNRKGDGPLLHNGQPVRVEIRSPGTREALNAQHKQEQAATLRTYAGMRGKAPKETVESKLEERADKLTAVTASFINFPVEARAVYTNPKMGWFTDQVAAFHADWANF